MKIYNIYPANKAGIIESAVFQSLNKAEAIAKFKNLETYTDELGYVLSEIEIKENKHCEDNVKILKIKNKQP